MVTSIRQASPALRDGTVRAGDLLEDALRKIAATEPSLHAWAHVAEGEAREAAELADAELAAGRWRGPLHGIPIGVKDVLHVAGMPTTAGSRVLRDFRPDQDATAVRRLREAGAVLVGKTVTHEFAYGQNAVATRNARDSKREPGSSSAGSAVAVASGSALATLGTDTGGSVRAPASLNGVVGVKPTYGRVSRFGVIPVSPSLDTVGVLTATVWDAGAVLSLIAGPDGLDRTALRDPVPDYPARIDEGAGQFRIGVVRAMVDDPEIDPHVRAAVGDALAQLEQLGHTLLDVTAYDFELAPTVGMTISLVDAAAVHARLIKRARDDYDPGTRAMLDAGALVPAIDYVKAMQVRTQLIDRVRKCFADARLDVMALPSVPAVAAFAGRLSSDMVAGGSDSLTAFLRYQFVANVTGLPAASIPCHCDGLPVGLQLLAPPLHEQPLLQLADQYERAGSGLPIGGSQ